MYRVKLEMTQIYNTEEKKSEYFNKYNVKGRNVVNQEYFLRLR